MKPPRLKTPRLEPGWGLVFGFFIAPVICIANGIIGTILTRGWEPGPDVVQHFLSLGFLALLLTGPMGFFTTRLIQIWNKGDTVKARALGIGCGIFAFCFWLWARHGLEQRWGRNETGTLLGGLLLPFAWSLLFPLFAIFARPGKD